MRTRRQVSAQFDPADLVFLHELHSFTFITGNVLHDMRAPGKEDTMVEEEALQIAKAVFSSQGKQLAIKS